jgi:hypothetical protein
MIVVSKKVSVTTRSAVQRWLLALDSRSRELFGQIVHSREFRVPSAAHFHPLRAMMAAGRARGLLESA